MKVGTIIYTLGLYTVVAVPAFVFTAKSMNIDISDTLAMIASGTIPEKALDAEQIKSRTLTPNDYFYLSETQKELETISPASGEPEQEVEDDLIRKILETDVQNKEAFDKIFQNQ